MHLISTLPGGWNPNDEGVFHIQQSTGDLLFLSAADTELFTVNKAYQELHQEETELPSVRLANLTYFKQELTIDTYIEEVVSEAKVVVLKLLGGTAYFSYLCEAIAEYAEDNDINVIFLPGDNKPDLELMQMSTLPLSKVSEIWQYFVMGGKENTKEVLKLIMNETLEYDFPIKAQESIPDLFLYHPSKGILNQPLVQTEKVTVLILGYRSYFLADNLDPFIAVTEELERRGVTAITCMALSYRDEDIQQRIFSLLENCRIAPPNVLINTTGFSLQGFQDNETKGIFDTLNVPVIQAILASCNKQVWEEGTFGLPPTDIAMNIALPEVDGKIITSVIAFKEAKEKDQLTDSEIVYFEPHVEGCQFVAEHAKAWIQLGDKENKQKNVAVILPNYPSKNSRLANGVGLDTPASTVEILNALKNSGYDLGENVPEGTEELMELLTENVTNELESLSYKSAEIKIKEEEFYTHYNQLSIALREKVEQQWGHPSKSPNYREGYFLIPGKQLGNIFLSIQPNRGYNIDLQATYHSPDLPPTYAYLAYYIWLQNYFSADAIIHVGKHGNLEWLPGKGVALSKESCFPAAILGAIPHFYPFIINDPGEGTQAKRRNHAIILDHLIPPMTRAENYGELLQLELLIDEFYESALLDPKRANLIKSKIENLVNTTHLRVDLNEDGKDIDALLEVIDGYLCELKEAQIRGGLHIFGLLPQEEKFLDMLVALHRLPQGETKSILQALAIDLELAFDPLDTAYETALKETIMGVECRTIGQAVEVLENRAKTIIEGIINHQEGNYGEETQKVVSFIKEKTIPTLLKTRNEIDHLLKGLNAQYIPAGGSGAPTRGRLDILPTGRNFYSVDTRTIPSPSAYDLGVKSAQNIIDRYLQEEGEYPSSVAISVWGTSTMRTGGDDIAQAFALLGVRPIWQGANRRVKDFEVISTLELKRPRVDVLLRISGFFRDAFPDVISLFNSAVEKVAQLDEPYDMNPIKTRFEKEREDWKKEGLDEKTAHERSLYRVFGSKPGAYGAGLQGLIDEKNWTNQEDLANVYINWGGYAYTGRRNEGKSAHETFRKRLSMVEVVVQNQDNREHDLLDSDDYYQFQGGMTAAVNLEKGEMPTTYFGDHSRPEQPRIKSLKEELLKVYRSRVVNPKWMEGMRDHGYKGAFEMAATMDYLFAYDATTNLIEDFMYEGITEEYLFNQKNQEFIRQHNPWALKDMSERMLEAIQRGLWENPNQETLDQLKSLYMKAEGELE
ncbi:cobaltochelatase subunit CobN [Flammeovirga sp. SJP92]|uniref:cobaltochelatase subunit CobN n=1 Tax=Flammeovirga sp. SJP92 TaxID=1775430 RepID=UPI000788CF30|nr:cobaltochelatase subunit CobN [Flammeovirga sp. SJP92]KXX68382.1 cobalamin biosynthesis protein CobN [Flammeovirga sp. SJP92]